MPLALALLTLVLAACGSAPSSTAAMPEPSQTFLVGRIAVDLPASARYAEGSNGGTHNWTPIEEELWPAGLALDGRDRDRARQADWAARVAEAEAAVAQTVRSARNRELSTEGLVLTDRAADVRGRWARALTWPDYTGRNTYVVLVADAGPVRLVTDKRVATDRLEASLDLFTETLGAYVLPDAPGYGAEDWLYLRHGAVARPPEGYEAAGARFDGVPPFQDWDDPDAVGLRVTTSTRLKPLQGLSLLGRWRETQEVGLARFFGGLLPDSWTASAGEVRARPRAANGLAGEELVSENVFEEKAGRSGPLGYLDFQWEHLGAPQDGGDPDVTVHAATPGGPPPSAAEADRALATWDAIVDSVRRHAPR